MNAPIEIPTFDMGSQIPRIIHQTCPSKNRLSDVLADNIQAIKAMNPGWEYRLYDDRAVDTFIVNSYGAEISNLFRRINPQYGAARADLFRYLLMYKHGGVYLDIKSTTLKPLDSVIRPDDKFILAHWRNEPGEPFAGWGMQKEFGFDRKREVQQWHIITVPGHPFLRRVIEQVLKNIQNYRSWVHGVGGRGVWKTTGPIAYTLAIEPLMSTNSYRMVANETELSLQYNIYNEAGHYNLFSTTYYGLRSDPVVSMEGWCSMPMHHIYVQARKVYRHFVLENFHREMKNG
ncbi:glycosyltransferase [Bradyrhizobium sp. Leo170]|uniref:glycosyltransferase family 32 protein n=1 Tax=Bradyrhizobium sp. Leo170 TaxID=1571199 RepID=UPI001FE1D795|nr:glycosyltransferase [Bradyrhizobium sp. Leo170]